MFLFVFVRSVVCMCDGGKKQGQRGGPRVGLVWLRLAPRLPHHPPGDCWHPRKAAAVAAAVFASALDRATPGGAEPCAGRWTSGGRLTTSFRLFDGADREAPQRRKILATPAASHPRGAPDKLAPFAVARHGGLQYSPRPATAPPSSRLHCGHCGRTRGLGQGGLGLTGARRGSAPRQPSG